MTVDEDPNETISNTLDILNVTVHSISERRISIPIWIETDHNTEKTHALVDCGAEGLFIDKSIAHKWKQQPINPIKVRNVELFTTTPLFRAEYGGIRAHSAYSAWL